MDITTQRAAKPAAASVEGRPLAFAGQHDALVQSIAATGDGDGWSS